MSAFLDRASSGRTTCVVCEWGRGKIVRAYDGKLEIEFPSGKRTLRADAPFLRRGR
ncbi:MAG: hypothetical protein NT062_32185 [Proteobacteria bacterium]|nr:hypothetical protein [Pseudomonadota bacterium]